MTRFLAIVEEGLRAAVRHPLRSLLTAATSAIAIAVTVNVISLVYGLGEDVMRDASRFGRRTVDVVRFPVLLAGLERGPLGDAEHARMLTVLDGLDALVLPRRQVPGVLRVDEETHPVGLVSAPPAYLSTIDVELVAGRWLDVDDAPGAACVLDAAVAALVFPGLETGAVIGRTVRCEAGGAPLPPCPVVGVLTDPLTHRELFDAFDEGRGARALTSSLLSFRNVYLPVGSLGAAGDYAGITVTLASDADVDDAARRLRTIWPADPADGLIPRRSVGVLVRREWMEMLGSSSQTGAFLSNVVWMIIVGVAIVMLSTLNLITIRERYDELAIRRVEGAGTRDVALQVTVEGVLLALVGGLAGLPLGYLGAEVLRTIVDFPFRFEFRYAVIATGIAILLGLVASVLPARHAARLQPVAVLTREAYVMADPLACLESVSRSYRSGPIEVEALRSVSLEVERGDYVAVSGPSGSGKSTLLHILGCLDRPTAGRYLLGGRDVSALTDRELAGVRNREIGFVFQRFHLLEDETALRNVELPLLYAGLARGERRRRAAEALERVGLEARGAHRPGQLSGGEQQRVALARALVKRPILLLADEPTGNLDSASGARVLDLVDAEYDRGTTVMLITHETAVAERASRRLRIKDGIVSGA